MKKLKSTITVIMALTVLSWAMFQLATIVNNKRQEIINHPEKITIHFEKRNGQFHNQAYTTFFTKDDSTYKHLEYNPNDIQEITKDDHITQQERQQLQKMFDLKSDNIHLSIRLVETEDYQSSRTTIIGRVPITKNVTKTRIKTDHTYELVNVE